MRQHEKTFVPGVLPIVKGESVVFSNDDPILHNVFSRSRAREFDLGKTRRGEEQKTRFDKTGVVDVYCNIHESMSASILVLPNRAFATTAPDGSFRIDQIPAGTHTAYAWVRGAEPMKQEVTFGANETKTLSFVLRQRRAADRHLDKHARPYKKEKTY
jgi:hypothetical protein